MKRAYYAVAEHLYYAVRDRKETDYCFITAFARIGQSKIMCSLPSGRDGWLNNLMFKFKPLTEVEYETHMALGSLEYKDSDAFITWSVD